MRRVSEDAQSRVRAQRQMAGCARLCRVLNVHVSVIGRYLPDEGRLIVSNHFGILDSLILASVLPVSFVAKEEMREWPFLGWIARSYGVLFVDRERRTTVSQFAAEVRSRIAGGVDVLVFPEGTTSPDLSVLPFKTGVFEAISQKAEHSVLPVYISVEEINGERALGSVRQRIVWSDPNLSFLRHCWDIAGLRKIKVEVRIGEPIPVGDRDRKELAQVSRNSVEQLRDGVVPRDEPWSLSGEPANAPV